MTQPHNEDQTQGSRTCRISCLYSFSSRCILLSRMCAARNTVARPVPPSSKGLSVKSIRIVISFSFRKWGVGAKEDKGQLLCGRGQCRRVDGRQKRRF